MGSFLDKLVPGLYSPKPCAFFLNLFQEVYITSTNHRIDITYRVCTYTPKCN